MAWWLVTAAFFVAGQAVDDNYGARSMPGARAAALGEFPDGSAILHAPLAARDL